MIEVRDLEDAALLAGLRRAAAASNQTTAEILAYLIEVERRLLHLKVGCSSLFGYCVEVLHMEEDVAYKRIQGARAVRKFPALLDEIRSGGLHLSAVMRLAPKLTPSTYDELVAACRHQSKRSVEQILAERFPSPDAAASLRKLPGSRQDIPGAEPREQVSIPLPALGPPSADSSRPQPAPFGSAAAAPAPLT